MYKYLKEICVCLLWLEFKQSTQKWTCSIFWTSMVRSKCISIFRVNIVDFRKIISDIDYHINNYTVGWLNCPRFTAMTFVQANLRKRTFTCAPNEDANQPVQQRSQIRFFVVSLKNSCLLGYPKWRFWLDCECSGWPESLLEARPKIRFLTDSSFGPFNQRLDRLVEISFIVNSWKELWCFDKLWHHWFWTIINPCPAA